MWREIDQFRLRQKSPEFFFAESELQCGFGKFLPFQPRRIIIECICGFAVGGLECDAELLVLEAAYSGNEIFLQKVRRTFGDLDRKLDERLWKLLLEVCSRGDEDVWHLRFNGYEAPDPILQWRKIPFDIDVHVAGSGIDHRVSLEYRHVLHFKQLSLYSCLEDSEVDGLTLTQFPTIKLRQAIIESSKPGEFSVEREAAVIADFAVVLMKTESGPLQRMSGQIRLYVLFGYRFKFCILCLCSENSTGKRERQDRNEQTERFPPARIVHAPLQPDGAIEWQTKAF